MHIHLEGTDICILIYSAIFNGEEGVDATLKTSNTLFPLQEGRIDKRALPASWLHRARQQLRFRTLDSCLPAHNKQLNKPSPAVTFVWICLCFFALASFLRLQPAFPYGTVLGCCSTFPLISSDRACAECADKSPIHPTLQATRPEESTVNIQIHRAVPEVPCPILDRWGTYAISVVAAGCLYLYLLKVCIY